MFSPTRTDVRAFFAETRAKRSRNEPLTPLETIAADWVDAHPEYASDLEKAASTDVATTAVDGLPVDVARPDHDDARENPFLHLSMHLAISEQLQIDQPPGLRAAYERLASRLGSGHAAQHQIMECLGETLWRAQRDRTAPDGAAYLECVRRRAST